MLLHRRGSDLVVAGLPVDIPGQLAFLAEQRVGIHYIIYSVFARRQEQLGERSADG
ncbi:hypothetical protein D3C71_1802170 [compost metagenome]